MCTVLYDTLQEVSEKFIYLHDVVPDKTHYTFSITVTGVDKMGFDREYTLEAETPTKKLSEELIICLFSGKAHKQIEKQRLKWLGLKKLKSFRFRFFTYDSDEDQISWFSKPCEDTAAFLELLEVMKNGTSFSDMETFCDAWSLVNG